MGCAPSAAARPQPAPGPAAPMAATLLYFPGPGRAVAPRLALFAALGPDFVNEGISFPEFMDAKAKLEGGEASRLVGSGSLPQLTLPDGQVFNQSMAITRYGLALAAAKRARGGTVEFDLAPPAEGDCAALLAAEEVLEFSMEILNKCPGDPDAEVKKQKRLEYAAEGGPMTKWFRILEARLTASGGPFVLGERLCIADVTLYQTTAMIRAGQFDHVEPSYLEQFPRCLAHIDAVLGSPLFKAYHEVMGDKAFVKYT
ncbi:unnamed protein product [Prorocentrum cordatum]|uniref:GST C-terminal domain-containing protein n=1 Tax=Prorocentrum cordatum TaxID=2364126 RepID=A0ABN9W673_9DINO|nr:unnamed protein product [Polarella glacialis]